MRLFFLSPGTRAVRYLPHRLNPSRGSATAFDLALPRGGPVKVEVFDVAGRRLKVLHDGPLSAGVHPLSLVWRDLPSGMYFLRASSRDAVDMRKVTLVR